MPKRILNRFLLPLASSPVTSSLIVNLFSLLFFVGRKKESVCEITVPNCARARVCVCVCVFVCLFVCVVRAEQDALSCVLLWVKCSRT